MRRCICFLLVLAEPCLHMLGLHTGVEALAPLAMNYLATSNDAA